MVALRLLASSQYYSILHGVSREEFFLISDKYNSYKPINKHNRYLTIRLDDVHKKTKSHFKI